MFSSILPVFVYLLFFAIVLLWCAVLIVCFFCFASCVFVMCLFACFIVLGLRVLLICSFRACFRLLLWSVFPSILLVFVYLFLLLLFCCDVLFDCLFALFLLECFSYLCYVLVCLFCDVSLRLLLFF